MRIQHNIAALNAHRQLGNNNSAVSKNLEKLSSGYRINRAGDDAAGLAISEKMRAQIKGLETASKNAQDGVSLIQTAEGALTEVHSMLNRMVELATQSANGTYGTEERTKISNEVNALKDEIDRISEGTNFNGINLLDGSLGESSNASDPNAKQFVTPTATGTAVTGNGTVNAAAQKNVYTTPAAFDDTKFDAFSVTFKNKEGIEKTIVFGETAVDGITATTAEDDMMKALTGSAATPDVVFQGTNTDDLAEFRELFNVTSTTGNISIESKDATSKAEITSLKVGSGNTTTGSSAIIALSTATPETLDATSVKKEDGGYGIKLDSTVGNIVDGDTIKIGGKTYEFDAAGGTAGVNSGNIAIARGTTTADTVKNLLTQLKKDGIEAHVDANDSTQLIITNTDKLKEVQGGAKFVSDSNGVDVTKKNAVKNSSAITFGGGAVGAGKVSFNYIDEDGKSQTKELDFTSIAASATGVGAGIKDAINNNEELKKLFDVTEDGTGVLTITAKKDGTDGAKFTGMSLTGTAAAGATMTTAETIGTNAGKEVEFNEDLKVGDTITVDGKTYEFVANADSKPASGNTAIVRDPSSSKTLENFSKQLEKDGITHKYDSVSNKITLSDREGGKKGGLQLQVGDTNDDFQKVSVSIASMSSKSLGLDAVNTADQKLAGASIDVIKKAIEKVSTARGDLGALQNRLDHTINNLGVTTENMTAAESRIRDVDMAQEMMTYTKNNILTQASQAMLAQANQLPQGVLQLLQ